MITKSPRSYRAYRISPGDTNRLALVFDPSHAGAGFVFAVEIFDVGGRTPPNVHRVAHEMFFVLKGQGRAFSGKQFVELKAGDSLLLPPGTPHVLENTGPTRLYCLTFMVPNESFAELIRAGEPVELDDEDRAVLSGGAKDFPTPGTMPALSYVNVMTRDMTRLPNFYMELFGFEEMPEVRTPAFRAVRTGRSALAFNASEIYSSLVLPDSPETVKGVKILLTFDTGSVSEVDRLIEQAVKLGATLVRAAFRTSYGYYQGILFDPEQNCFRINTAP